MAGIFTGLASGLLGLGASIFGADAEKNAQAQAQQNQLALQTQAFNQQTAYIEQQAEAQRGAIQGIASQGNPYFNAAQSLPKPTFAAGGQFGPAPSTGANMNPMAAGAFSQVPAPQAAAQAPSPGNSPVALPPGAVQRPPMAQGATQTSPPGLRRTS